ncbi:DMT family transporter [Pikeienuella sp. HZG-20]|uniref:DMT family transporter n=1 Tax=Paludibacillus litoralis TaxID=3133267 RepID=UPI0030ED209C
MIPNAAADREYRRGFALVALGAFCFAPDSLLLRLMALDQWPTMFWRGLVTGATITLILSFIHGRRYPARLRALGRPGLAFIAVFVCSNFCFIFAVRETSVGNTLFILSTSPVFSALISWAALGERPDRRTFRTIAIAIAGVALIAFGAGGEGGPNSLIGDLAALGAAILLATSFVISRRVRPLDMAPMLGPSFLVVAVLASFFVSDFNLPAASLTPLLLMGLVFLPAATWCIITGPRLIPAVEVSLLMLIEAVFGPLIVWWALDEYPGDMTLIGGAMILSALAWSSLERIGDRKARRPDGRA